MNQMTGKQLIAAERTRQIESEGWSLEHDDQTGPEVLEQAALCYRDAAGDDCSLPTEWPWSAETWKPSNRRRNLERAGALYQAAADVAERSGNYQRRDNLLEHVEGCAIRLDSIQATQPLESHK